MNIEYMHSCPTYKGSMALYYAVCIHAVIAALKTELTNYFIVWPTFPCYSKNVLIVKDLILLHLYGHICCH